MIFFQTPAATLRCGDALAELRALPADSVHCCVTSPPYWGLRAYGAPPQVWGGAEGCEHAWIVDRYCTQQSAASDGCAEAFSQAGEANAERLKRARWREDAFCQCCGAWRGELGLEPTIDLYIEHMVAIFEEVRRVLRPDGTLWLNMGDSYACKPNGRSAAATKAAGRDDRRFRDKPATGFGGGLKEKDLVGQPWRLAFALQAAGWWLRSDIIWAKDNGMPSSVDDRPGCAHEYLFLLSKSKHYFYDWYALRERCAYPNGGKVTGRGLQAYNAQTTQHSHDNSGGYPRGEWRNKRTVWRINTQASGEEHFASFPADLVKPCILAGTSEYGCCANCGKPYTRIVEKSGGNTGKLGKESEYDRSQEEAGTSRLPMWRTGPNVEEPYRVESLGWKKHCRCKVCGCNGKPLAIQLSKEGSNATQRQGSTECLQAGVGEAEVSQRCRVPEADYSEQAQVPGDVRGVRKGVCRDGKGQSVLQRSLYDEMAGSHGQGQSFPEGPCDTIELSEGLHAAQLQGEVEEPGGISADPCPRSSERERKGLCAGPPPRHGRASGPASGRERGGASPERRQDGQQDGKPQIVVRERASLPDGDQMSALRETVVCGRCGQPIVDAPRQPCVVLDPFSGTGITGLVALQLGRRYHGIELLEKYCKMQRKRLLAANPPIPELAAL